MNCGQYCSGRRWQDMDSWFSACLIRVDDDHTVAPRVLLTEALWALMCTTLEH
jgi:hypothetical protein